ncbi:hypothetical protein ACS0TY_005485 [Phlomoides rotata]
MEVPSEEGEMPPIPLSSSYGHGHMIHHHHNLIMPPISDDPFKKTIRYRECLKNHAAAMGGNATDGCGEFMPSGDEGTLEALTCSACNCHRNFHRKEIDGEPRKIFHHYHPSRPVAPHPMIMSYNMAAAGASDQSDEHDAAVARPPAKKRFRTKFTAEQKERMLDFAEKVGWKIQKQEEAVVQQFCQEVGVKRRVLKVWMHNNKHNLAKKNHIIQSDIHPQTGQV